MALGVFLAVMRFLEVEKRKKASTAANWSGKPLAVLIAAIGSHKRKIKRLTLHVGSGSQNESETGVHNQIS